MLPFADARANGVGHGRAGMPAIVYSARIRPGLFQDAGVRRCGEPVCADILALQLIQIMEDGGTARYFHQYDHLNDGLRIRSS